MAADRAAQALLLFHQGEQHLASAAPDLARLAFEQAIALQPAFAEAHANRALALEQQGDTVAAEESYRHAAALQPDNPTIHLNLGALLAKQKRHTEAEASYAHALALDPQSSAVWSNLGALNLNLQREATAEACLRQAMQLDATNAKARFNLAYLQLRRGNFEEGWTLFESRPWQQPVDTFLRCPRWHGKPLQGKSLLIRYEGGHGDMIQFCRYIPLLARSGTQRIALLCQPALQRLLKNLPGLDAVYPLDQPLPPAPFDYWMPLLSAPYHLRGEASRFGADAPYLTPDPALRAQWTSSLQPGARLRVGLVWRGNPRHENDRDRSLPHLGLLAPLWGVAGVQFVSLQMDANSNELDAYRSTQPLLSLGHRLGDFADAAALMEHLDLVISVDTAVAHLAGAIGKPCWLLLPWYMCDWRWGGAGDSTPWYPQTMRLFRQSAHGDWNSVLQPLTQALEERACAI